MPAVRLDVLHTSVSAEVSRPNTHAATRRRCEAEPSLLCVVTRRLTCTAGLVSRVVLDVLRSQRREFVPLGILLIASPIVHMLSHMSARRPRSEPQGLRGVVDGAQYPPSRPADACRGTTGSGPVFEIATRSSDDNVAAWACGPLHGQIPDHAAYICAFDASPRSGPTLSL